MMPTVAGYGISIWVKNTFYRLDVAAMNFRRLITNDRTRTVRMSVLLSRAYQSRSHNRRPIGSLAVYLCKIAYHNLRRPTR